MDTTEPGTRLAALVLTVEESGDLMRIGRTLAYQLAGEYLATGGTAGLPVIRIGTCLRVPRWALIELITTGRVVRLCDAVVPTLDASTLAVPDAE
ncbi:MAG: hypothetical protein ABIR68_09245 [Ilumatobacteraceae bacterium]